MFVEPVHQLSKCGTGEVEHVTSGGSSDRLKFCPLDSGNSWLPCMFQLS